MNSPLALSGLLRHPTHTVLLAEVPILHPDDSLPSSLSPQVLYTRCSRRRNPEPNRNTCQGSAKCLGNFQSGSPGSENQTNHQGSRVISVQQTQSGWPVWGTWGSCGSHGLSRSTCLAFVGYGAGSRNYRLVSQGPDHLPAPHAAHFDFLPGIPRNRIVGGSESIGCGQLLRN